MTLEQAIETLKEELDHLVMVDEANGDVAKAIKVVAGNYYHNLKRRKGKCNCSALPNTSH
jgi:hypothetical protein